MGEGYVNPYATANIGGDMDLGHSNANLKIADLLVSLFRKNMKFEHQGKIPT